MSSIYENNVNTLGFWKFSNDKVLSNSITDSNISLNYYTPTSVYNNITTSLPQFRSKEKYKSRGSSLLLNENNGIMFNSLSYGNSLTTEFWFYPKKLESNYNDPSETRTISEKQHNFIPTNNVNNWNDSNPFLYAYGPELDTPTSIAYERKAVNVGNSSNPRIHYYYYFPIYVFLSYCVINKRFTISMMSDYIEMPNVSSVNIKPYIETATITNCAPNKWYHIAITQNTDSTNKTTLPSTLSLFINGKKSFSKTFTRKAPYDYESQSTFTALAGKTYNVFIGNRKINSETTPVNFTSIPSTPNFQDVFIDDLRVTRGVLYTEDFIPPGLVGKQILLYDDYAYYMDIGSDSLIKLSFAKWSDISDSDKLILLNRVDHDYFPSVDKIKILQTDPSKPIQVENYQLDNIKPNIYIEKIDSSATQIVYPTKFFDYGALEDYLNNITASSNITSPSNIRLSVTRDGLTYYTYSLVNNEWVPLDNREDVLTEGIRLTDLKDIPKSGWIQFGLEKFAFSIGLYRNEDSSKCQINDITINLSMTDKWIKSNTTTQSKYKYIGPTLLRITFLEDGKYKVNYNDRG